MLALLLALPMGSMQAEAQPRKQTGKSAAAAKASPKKAPAKRATTSKPAPASKARATSGGSDCQTVRVKSGKGYRNVRRCTKEPTGPLQGGAVTPGESSQPELRARTIPDRAYAVDGHTFFHQGRKYQIVGLNEALVPAGNDLAKQRLQLALDSGTVSVEPDKVDDAGTVHAVVKVSGKNLADILNAR
ncbi:hypothetical protein GCM10025770_10670 [Viridibacterium curvum]|uniref:Uncharacterized protein n=2 Tax=Viridibacterium curvum TaxID=1101404 RepID=A0ABP9QG98_9RHOO